MGLPLTQQATYEDLLALPEKVVGEIICGRLVTHPRPGPRHTRAYSALGVEIGGAYDRGVGGPGGWWILDEPELHLDADVLVPDLAGWRRERMPRLPQTAWFELAPDWICEILSPSTARIDRVEKLPIYSRHSVGHVWLIDPDQRTLEVFENRAERWTLLVALADDARVSQPPFGETSFELSALWAD